MSHQQGRIGITMTIAMWMPRQNRSRVGGGSGAGAEAGPGAEVERVTMIMTIMIGRMFAFLGRSMWIGMGIETNATREGAIMNMEKGCHFGQQQGYCCLSR
jgi:hypothetical protein